MPQRWLLKTEPTEFSYDDLVGDRRAVWDGVTNNLALKNIRTMRKGDLAFIYHTGDEKAVVGIAEVVSDPYPDPKKNDPKLVVVDLKPKQRLSRVVTLAEIKSCRTLKNFDLVRISRLSVVPVSADQWQTLLSLAK